MDHLLVLEPKEKEVPQKNPMWETAERFGGSAPRGGDVVITHDGQAPASLHSNTLWRKSSSVEAMSSGGSYAPTSSLDPSQSEDSDAVGDSGSDAPTPGKSPSMVLLIVEEKVSFDIPKEFHSQVLD